MSYNLQYDHIWIEIPNVTTTDRYRLKDISEMSRYTAHDGTQIVRFVCYDWEDENAFVELPWGEGGEMLWGMVSDTTIQLCAVEHDEDEDEDDANHN